MHISVRCVSYSELNAAIQLLRSYTGESIATIKEKLNNRSVVMVIDTAEDQGAEILALIEKLENRVAGLRFTNRTTWKIRLTNNSC